MTTKTTLTGAAAEAVWDWLLAEVLRHKAEIGPIVDDGDVACVVITPSARSRALLAETGWDGSPVVRWTRSFCFKMASQSDPVTAAWLRREDGPFRLFVIAESATYLLNCDEQGWSVEPGSLDEEAAG